MDNALVGSKSLQSVANFTMADEDTAIYNLGLMLLTESKKNCLVKTIVQSKVMAESWSADAQAGFDFLKVRLDLLHMYELWGCLGIVPFYGAAMNSFRVHWHMQIPFAQGRLSRATVAGPKPTMLCLHGCAWCHAHGRLSHGHGCGSWGP